MAVAENFEFFNPHRIISGERALENLPFELLSIGASRPFCLWAGKQGRKILPTVIKAFKGSAIPLTVPESVAGEPDASWLEEMAVDFRTSACDVLLVIGDQGELALARRLGRLVSAGQRKAAGLPAADDSRALALPLIQLYTGFQPQDAKPPQATKSPEQLPRGSNPLPVLVVLDSRLLPDADWLTEVSGALTVLARTAEWAVGPLCNPLSIPYALAAMRLVAGHVTILGDKHRRPRARLALANAAVLCRCVGADASASLCALLAEELARLSSGDTGILAGLLLPYVLEIAGRIRPGAVAELLPALGGPEIYSLTADSLRARKAVNRVHELLQFLHRRCRDKIPTTLRQAGYTEATLGQAARAAADRDPILCRQNPLHEILHHAWLGRPLAMSANGLAAP